MKGCKSFSLYRLLEFPWIYRLANELLAPGAEARLKNKIQSWIEILPQSTPILDIACGPSSWLWKVGVRPIGVDLSQTYTEKFSKNGECSIGASAITLPIKSECVPAVWCIGLLHHLPDSQAKAAIHEMIRIVKPGGYLMIFDGILPESIMKRPLAWILRKLDRGRFMRYEKKLRELFPQQSLWKYERINYSSFGHEGVFCFYRKK